MLKFILDNNITNYGFFGESGIKELYFDTQVEVIYFLHMFMKYNVSILNDLDEFFDSQQSPCH